jgi:hypothetical protein
LGNGHRKSGRGLVDLRGQRGEGLLRVNPSPLVLNPPLVAPNPHPLVPYSTPSASESTPSGPDSTPSGPESTHSGRLFQNKALKTISSRSLQIPFAWHHVAGTCDITCNWV